MAPGYQQVIAQNARSARRRLGLDQEPLAARMRAAGFPTWRRQTVASVEKGERRLYVEEAVALAMALETTAAQLLMPPRVDKTVSLPSGTVVPSGYVAGVVTGVAAEAVEWKDGRPLFEDLDPEAVAYAWNISTAIRGAGSSATLSIENDDGRRFTVVRKPQFEATKRLGRQQQ